KATKKYVGSGSSLWRAAVRRREEVAGGAAARRAIEDAGTDPAPRRGGGGTAAGLSGAGRRAERAAESVWRTGAAAGPAVAPGVARPPGPRLHGERLVGQEAGPPDPPVGDVPAAESRSARVPGHRSGKRSPLEDEPPPARLRGAARLAAGSIGPPRPDCR